MYIDSYYDTFYEFSQYQESIATSTQYQLAEKQYFRDANVHVYLIYDRAIGKYGMYVVEMDISEWPHCTSFIVQNFTQLGLDFALFYYPHYGFNEEYYGF